MEAQEEPIPQVSQITDGLVFTGAAFTHAPVYLEDDMFAAIGGPARTPDAEVIDASDAYVIPGLIDMHFHGCHGVDFSDGQDESLHTLAAYEASRGITAICPASMTFPFETLETAYQIAAAFVPTDTEAALVGINMEGPYISPENIGAQNPAFARLPDANEFMRLQEAADGLIKVVDIAPELDGAVEFIDEVAPLARVSVAHTVTDYEHAVQAFEHGARHMTHMFNAMTPLRHHLPGPIAAAAERDDVTVELIADGEHVHPAMIRLAFKLFGAGRVVLISDSMRACGLGDGTYDLGGQAVTVVGRRATGPNGKLAGSVTDLMECMRCAVQEMDIPLELAIRAATLDPARELGVDDTRGSITAGKIADAVILNNDLSIRHVILRGKLLK